MQEFEPARPGDLPFGGLSPDGARLLVNNGQRIWSISANANVEQEISSSTQTLSRWAADASRAACSKLF